MAKRDHEENSRSSEHEREASLKTHERISHLNRMLRATRRVNQETLNARDETSLIRAICSALVESLGFETVWMAILGEQPRTVSHVAFAGFESEAFFEPMRARLESGELSQCLRDALETGQAVQVRNRATDCPDCPLACRDSDSTGLALLLSSGDRPLGFIRASIPAGAIEDEEETQLLIKLGDDVARALDHLRRDRQMLSTRQRLEAIFDGSRDGMVFINADGRVTDANRAFCDMLGYTLEELRAFSSFRDFTPGKWSELEDSDTFRTRVLGEQGYSGFYEKEYIRKDGTVFPVEMQAHAERGPDGSLLYLWALVRDITARKQAEAALAESEQSHRSLFEVMNQGVVYQDSDSRILSANPAACEILGLSLDQIMGKTSLDPDWHSIHEDGSPFPGEEHPGVQALRTGRKVLGVVMGVRHARDSQTRWISIDATPQFRPGEDTPFRVYTIFSDITEQRRFKHERQEIENRMELALLGADLGTWDWYLRTGLTIYNERWAQMLGHDLSEIETHAKEWSNRIHPDDREPTLAALHAHMRGETPLLEIEHRLRHKDGHWVWVLDRGRVIERDEDGNALRACGTHLDISGSKRAVEALRASEIRYRTLAENFPGGALFLIDRDETILAADGRAFHDIGLPPENVAGRKVSDAFAEIGEHILPKVQKYLQGHEVTYETTFSGRLYSNHAFPIGEKIDGRNQAIVVVQDITEERAARNALEEATLRLEEAVRAGNVGLWDWDVKTDIVRFSPEWKKQIGYEEHEIAGDFGEWRNRVHPDDLESSLRTVQESLDQRLPGWQVEFRFRHKNGSYRRILAQTSVEYDEAGDPLRVRGSHIDFTETHAREEERSHLLEAISQAAETILIIGRDGFVTFANPAFETTSGFSAADAVGTHVRDLYWGSEDHELDEKIWKTILAGDTWMGRITNRRRDGSPLVEEATITPVIDASGVVVSFVAVKRDITRELNLEEQYRQAQKMEAIGQLTGGVAHDFNNLLQVINGCTELVLMQTSKDDPLYPLLADIENAGNRAARLVSQLLLFSRRQIMRPEIIDLNDTVGTMLKMLTRLIGEQIELFWHPARHLNPIEADRGMIEQALMNLCVNARDAMSRGGTLTIETRRIVLDDDFCQTHTEAQPGEYAVLSVSDTGEGMDPATIDRIFEPFFTTKELGKGTGLGLATVYGIIKQHGGFVTVYSEPGRGSTFKLYWPADQAENGESSATIAASDLLGTETILLAEDDDSVRRFATVVLQRAGYTVLPARNGQEALDIFKHQASTIDAAVLDVVMPRIGGKEVYDAIRDERPRFRVLFASGYSESGLHTDFTLHDGLTLLSKPFTRQEFLTAVRQMLDAPEAPASP